MILKACIFDLDGVVVDTAKYHYLAWKSIAEELNFSFTETDNERLKGVSRMTSLEILLEIGKIALTTEEKEFWATKKNNIYLQYIDKLKPDEVLPGVIPLFESLKNAGIKIALGSASKNAAQILDKLEINHYFDSIIDGTKVSKAKPDPEVFLKGAEALKVLPEESIVFEDAEMGVEAAKNGNMKCIGIGSPAVLGKADIVLSDLTDFTMQTLIKAFDVTNI